MQEFMLPIDFMDNYILKAKPEYAMVYLYAFRHKKGNRAPAADKISSSLGMDQSTVEEAIKYWVNLGVDIFEPKIEQLPERPIYSVEELNELSKSQPDFEFLRNTVETILGKALTLNNCQTLAWMYKEAGLDVSSIILIANYAKKVSKPRMRFMENIVEKMIKDNVKTYEDTEKFIAKMKRADSFQNKIKKMYGIERELTQSEKLLFNTWLDEIKPKDEELMRAFEECVERTGKYSARYINAILINWKNERAKPKKINTIPTPKATKFNNFEASGNIDYKKLELEALRKQLARLKEGEKNG